VRLLSGGVRGIGSRVGFLVRLEAWLDGECPPRCLCRLRLSLLFGSRFVVMWSLPRFFARVQGFGAGWNVWGLEDSAVAFCRCLCVCMRRHV
jgi:hypothetical protein